MVHLGDILISGKNTETSKEFLSAIVFGLNSEIRGKHCFIFDDWEVEIGEEEYIIARTTTACPKEMTHKLGYEVCEKALDLYAAQGQGSYTILEPYHRYVIFGFDTGKSFLEMHDITDISMDISIEMQLVDKNGTLIPPAPVSQPVWEYVFRYYRFSQTSNNMYDAYRWLYLMFETLLQTIEPIKLKPNGKPAEGERAWIERALRLADTTLRWSSVVNWSASDSVTYFLINQYDNIRCKLFHAKGGHILPNDQLSAHAVHKMLLELESLCLHLLYKLYPIRGARGSITYNGFELIMKAGFNDTTGFACNVATEPQNRTKGIDLSGPYLSLEQDVSASNTAFGIDTRVYVAELGSEKYSIRSYGIKNEDGVLMFGGFGKTALSISDVDRLALFMQTRMVNRGAAKHFL